MEVIAYTREGFEKEAAAEIVDRFAESSVSCYANLNGLKGLARVIFYGISWKEANDIIRLDQLIFSRQIFFSEGKLEKIAEDDRIEPLISSVKSLLPDGLYKDVIYDVLDSNEGKSLSRFGKKFLPVFKRKLEKTDLKKIFSKKPAPYIHICFEDYENAWIGVNDSFNRNENPAGIMRLKFPADAPSRSTLKLEEAILDLLPKGREFFEKGMSSADLGAAPGGWTYQLVARGLEVFAIDNGPMRGDLMDSGLVTHLKENAYTYKPPYQLDWMVCDMVDSPIKVANLMGEWFSNQYTKRAIFNLKLPMKKRYVEVNRCLEEFWNVSQLRKEDCYFKAKQLYHDREEITVAVISDYK